MQSYDYAHRAGVDEISWERFGTLVTALAEKIAPASVDLIVGVARAGLFPATAVACALRCDLYPVRLTRRANDQVVRQHPLWTVDVAPDIAGKSVAVIDEMADTGETLALVAARVRECGCAHVLTASLVAHSWAQPRPDHVALMTDALVIFPWDKRVYQHGRWQPHPEIEEALRLQGQNSANGLDSAS